MLLISWSPARPRSHDAISVNNVPMTTARLGLDTYSLRRRTGPRSSNWTSAPPAASRSRISASHGSSAHSIAAPSRSGTGACGCAGSRWRSACSRSAPRPASSIHRKGQPKSSSRGSSTRRSSCGSPLVRCVVGNAFDRRTPGGIATHIDRRLRCCGGVRSRVDRRRHEDRGRESLRRHAGARVEDAGGDRRNRLSSASASIRATPPGRSRIRT